MIEIRNLTKRFGEKTAVDNLTTDIAPGGIFGLVGVNGSGKSTLLRLISGVFHPDCGTVKLFGEESYDNAEAKKHLVYIPDNIQLIHPRASMSNLAAFYSACYENFSYEKFNKYTNLFGLNPKAAIRSFSKGMTKQAQTVLGLSCNTDIIMFDETYDGLDPLAKKAAARLIYSEVCDRNACVIMTSHSLRELEDTCDSLALMYNGKLVLQSDVVNLKTKMFKIQIAFNEPTDEAFFAEIPNTELMSLHKNGKVSVAIMKGDREGTDAYIKSLNPLLYELLPLTLEEVFSFEMDSFGYHIDEII